jgi:predicted DsbA family dithiol-disulfide isomerase
MILLCKASVRMGSKMMIDIVSDTVCPWCFIGKRRLETALRQLQVK